MPEQCPNCQSAGLVRKTTAKKLQAWLVRQLAPMAAMSLSQQVPEWAHLLEWPLDLWVRQSVVLVAL